MIDSLPRPVVPPSVEVSLHRGERRELSRQKAPLAARLRDVEDRIDDISQGGFAGSPATCRCRKVRFDHAPLLVGGIACIAPPIAAIFGARDFSPGHRVIPRVFATTRGSTRLKSRNPCSG